MTAFATLVAALLVAAPVSADAPRTSWGVPDLSGTWDYYGRSLSRDRATGIVVDPPDGRIPALTAAAMARLAAMRERMERPPRTPADRPPETRCIVGFGAGPPLSSASVHYNNYLRIVQSPGYVAILVEMINDHRIVATGGGRHMADGVRFWKGYSRGRWEGDTLVVETRNFTDHTSFWGSGPDMHLTERFKRIDEDTLRYRYTVDDPAMFAATWSVEQDFVRTDEEIYEYACHEGNRSLVLQMRAAHRQYARGETTDRTWLPTWFRWLPRTEDIPAAERNGQHRAQPEAADSGNR